MSKTVHGKVLMRAEMHPQVSKETHYRGKRDLHVKVLMRARVHL